MNAVEIEQAISELALQPFDTAEFPFAVQHKADFTACAEAILLAREAHFPATVADLYDPEDMPENARHAHARNDEVLERIYIGRRFKNDTKRLEKLFELYTTMTAAGRTKPATKASKGKQAANKGLNNGTDLAGRFPDFPLREATPAQNCADVPRLKPRLDVENGKK
jgi:hypothetical protein